MDWMYIVSGFGIGLLVGISGVGGGSLMTPLLVLVFGIKPVVAVGTDLLFAAITKMGGAWTHNRRGTVDWKIVRHLAMGSLPAALVTLGFLDAFHKQGKDIGALITPVLGVALILTSLALLFKIQIQRLGGRELTLWIGHEGRRTGLTIACGVVLGVLVTISSVGAGALGMAMLFFLYPTLPTVRLVGTDIAHAVPLTLIGGLGHLHMGTVDLSLLATLLIGSLPGIYLGSRLSSKLPEHVLRPILAVMLMVIGSKFAF